MSLEKRRQRRDLTAAFSYPTRGCKEVGSQTLRGRTRLKVTHGKFQLDTSRTFFITREVRYWKEGSERCRDLHPRS